MTVDKRRRNSAMMGVVKAVCQKFNIAYEEYPQVYAVKFFLPEKGFASKLQLATDACVLGVLVEMPFIVPLDRRDEMAVGLCMLNDRFIDGNFDFDYIGGRVLFRVTSSYRDSLIGEPTVMQMLIVASETASAYAAALNMLSSSGDLVAFEKMIQEVNLPACESKFMTPTKGISPAPMGRNGAQSAPLRGLPRGDDTFYRGGRAMSDSFKSDAAYETSRALVEAMRALGMKYSCPSEYEYEFTFHGDDLVMPFRMRVDAERQLVLLLSPQQFTVKPARVRAVAAAIGQINFLLDDGSFDFDVIGGTITFRMTSTFAGSIISPELFKFMIEYAVAVVDEYNDKLLLISKGYLDAAEFIRGIN